MLNSYNSNKSVINQNVKFNAVSGTMFKSCEGSFFKRFGLKSEFADSIFAEVPVYHRKEYREGSTSYSSYYADMPVKAVVLQVMMVGDMEVIAEIIEKEKYEQLLGVTE